MFELSKALDMATMSAANKVEAQPAFLLHRREYRESSLIVELYSAEHGRISVVAKGVRSARSEKKGLLQPFQPLLVWWQGRSDLKTLTSVESSGHYPLLKAKSLASGFYINELMMKLTQRLDANLELFKQYHDCLLMLSSLPLDDNNYNARLQAGLRYFELDLIQASGYGVSLNVTADDATAVEAGRHYLFYPEHGAVHQTQDSSIADGLLQIDGDCLLALHHRQLLVDDINSQKHLLKQAKLLNQFLLQRLLGGQALHSRELLSPGG